MLLNTVSPQSALIADESTNIAGKQLVSFILRHVAESFEIHEGFSNLRKIDNADFENLSAVSLECLFGLNLNNHLAS
jgi:hypothetical protein